MTHAVIFVRLYLLKKEEEDSKISHGREKFLWNKVRGWVELNSLDPLICYGHHRFLQQKKLFASLQKLCLVFFLNFNLVVHAHPVA